MIHALLLEFGSVSAAEYHAINAQLSMDAASGLGDFPAGLLSHTGAVTAAGNLVVFELWDSQEAQKEFMAQRLGPVFDRVGVNEPIRMEWCAVAGHFGS